jgi:hypothetical protein
MRNQRSKEDSITDKTGNELEEGRESEGHIVVKIHETT